MKLQLTLLSLCLLFISASCSNDSLSGENVIAFEAAGELPSSGTEKPGKKDFTLLAFDDLETGEVPEQIILNSCDGYIIVNALHPDYPSVNTCHVFDSSKPNPGNEDLGTPNEMFGGPGKSADGPQESNDSALRNVLFISDDPNSPTPVVSYREGTKFIFNFTTLGDGHTTLQGFDLLDLNEAGIEGMPSTVKLYEQDNVLIREFTLPRTADNGRVFVNLENTTGVTAMVIEMNNAGAVDNLRLSCSSASNGNNGNEGEEGQEEEEDSSDEAGEENNDQESEEEEDSEEDTADEDGDDSSEGEQEEEEETGEQDEEDSENDEDDSNGNGNGHDHHHDNGNGNNDHDHDSDNEEEEHDDDDEDDDEDDEDEDENDEDDDEDEDDRDEDEKDDDDKDDEDDDKDDDDDDDDKYDNDKDDKEKCKKKCKEKCKGKDKDKCKKKCKEKCKD